MDIQVDLSGNLKLSLEPGEAEEVRERLEQAGEDLTLLELAEPYFTNGGFHPFSGDSGNPYVGLTSAPCIAESLSFDDDGQATIEGRLWWFPDYAVRSFMDELVAKGEVTFPIAPGYEPEAPAARRPGPGR